VGGTADIVQDTGSMNLAPFQVKVAALSDEGLATAAVAYLDEAPDALRDAEYEDLWYRIVVLTAYKNRIAAADLEGVERALKRINHQRQTREPHRMLGGIVPPLVEEVTVRTVSKTPTKEPLTRTRKLDLLNHYAREGIPQSSRRSPSGETSGRPRDRAARSHR
jgi:hypothetical protein